MIASHHYSSDVIGTARTYLLKSPPVHIHPYFYALYIPSFVIVGYKNPPLHPPLYIHTYMQVGLADRHPAGSGIAYRISPNIHIHTYFHARIHTYAPFPSPPLPLPSSPAKECLIARHDRHNCGSGDPQTRNNKHAGVPKYLDTRDTMKFSPPFNKMACFVVCSPNAGGGLQLEKSMPLNRFFIQDILRPIRRCEFECARIMNYPIFFGMVRPATPYLGCFDWEGRDFLEF